MGGLWDSALAGILIATAVELGKMQSPNEACGRVREVKLTRKGDHGPHVSFICGGSNGEWTTEYCEVGW